MSTFVYALKLEKEKYYIGKSSVPKSRILSHFKSNGSEWTSLYKPLSVVEVVKGDAFDEDKITKQYMDQYGVDNVRGGSYCKPKLFSCQYKSLETELKSLRDQCYKCGESGHLMKSCSARKRARASISRVSRVSSCTRCGRNTHTRNQCYASYDIDGERMSKSYSQDAKKPHVVIRDSFVIRERVAGSKCSSRSTWKYIQSYSSESEASSGDDDCSRCHRHGHNSSQCYARTYSDGSPLIK